MFKDSKDGQTNFCPHEIENNSICDKCLGKPEWEKLIKDIFQRNIFDEVTYIDRLAEERLIKGADESVKDLIKLLTEECNRHIEKALEEQKALILENIAEVTKNSRTILEDYSRTVLEDFGVGVREENARKQLYADILSLPSLQPLPTNE